MAPHCECNGRSATCQRHRPRYVTHPLFPPPPSLPGPIAVRPLSAASPASATSPSLSLSSTTRRRFRPTSTALRLPSLLPASAAVPSAAMSSSVSLLWVRLELPVQFLRLGASDPDQALEYRPRSGRRCRRRALAGHADRGGGLAAGRCRSGNRVVLGPSLGAARPSRAGCRWGVGGAGPAGEGRR